MKDFADRDLERARSRQELARRRWQRYGGIRRERERASEIERMWREEAATMAMRREDEPIMMIDKRAETDQ